MVFLIMPQPKSKVDQKILIDRFLALRSLMEESGMIKWEYREGNKGKKVLTIEPNCINKLKLLYPDKKKVIYLGEKAKDELVISLKGLVIERADYWLTKANASRDKLKDFIQDGWLGVSYALYKFNPSKNTKFSSYAAMWIKARILRGSFQDYLIKTDLQYEILKLTIPSDFKRFDLLAFQSKLLWIYLSQKTIYSPYPFRFYTQIKNAEGDQVDIFDTIQYEDKKTLTDKVYDVLSPEEIKILTSDDQSKKKKKNQSMGILELALMQGISLDSFYNQKQQIIDKVMESIEL